jgi:hypothetical protein
MQITGKAKVAGRRETSAGRSSGDPSSGGWRGQAHSIIDHCRVTDGRFALHPRPDPSSRPAPR